MLDYESEIFSEVAEPLRVQFPGIFVSGEATNSPASFPAVTIIEADNAVYTRRSTQKLENAVRVMIEMDIFTNDIGYKKLRAKEILAFADGEFERLGFTRTMASPVANLQDNTIYRLKARYEAYIDADGWVYQN